jgi:hypothetical protein
MGIVPLDLQRRFEQRWAARFASPVALNPPRDGLPKPRDLLSGEDVPLKRTLSVECLPQNLEDGSATPAALTACGPAISSRPECPQSSMPTG